MENPPRTQDPADEELGLGPNAPQRQRSSVPSFLFISFLFFMLNNHDDGDAVNRFQYKDAIQALDYQMSNYSAWLNGSASNFSLPARIPYLDPLIQNFVSFGPELDPQHGSYYANVSALFRGDVAFHNLTAIPYDTNVTWHALADNFMNGTNATSVLEHLGSWNWSNTDKVGIKIYDRKVARTVNVTDDIAIFHGKLELFDPEASDSLLLDFDGVHFVNNGSFYAYAEQDGRASLDIRYVPYLVPELSKNTTARVVEVEMSRRLDKLRDVVDFGVLDDFSNNEGSQTPTPKCPFILYGQLAPTSIPKDLMQELEQETEKPTGITTVVPPKLIFNGVMISRTCGILYEISKTKGLKTWSFHRRVTSYAGASAVLYLALLVLLSRQISLSRTPAGVSRLSRWTFLTQGLVDTISFVVLVTLAVVVEGRASLSLIAPAALSCILFIYEMQFAVLIYRIQLPEDNAAERTPPVAASPPAEVAVAQPTDTLEGAPPAPPIVAPAPAPAAQSPQRDSFWRFFIHHVRTDPQARLWMTMSFFLMVMFRIVMILSLPLLAMMVAYSMFWFPQIARSAQRGRTGALSKEYLIGTTICRMCFALYFLAYDDNILDVESRPWIYPFTCWMFFQVFFIVLQDFYGPAFFLPSRFAKAKTYDYHPPMPAPDSEAPEQSLGDCSICMDTIFVESPNNSNEKGQTNDGTNTVSGGFFSAVQRGVTGGATGAKKSYSLAPCHHLFHTSCLERWLAIKNICPQCRRPLPPLG